MRAKGFIVDISRWNTDSEDSIIVSSAITDIGDDDPDGDADIINIKIGDDPNDVFLTYHQAVAMIESLQEILDRYEEPSGEDADENND
jgi:hypothetical protein